TGGGPVPRASGARRVRRGVARRRPLLRPVPGRCRHGGRARDEQEARRLGERRHPVQHDGADDGGRRGEEREEHRERRGAHGARDERGAIPATAATWRQSPSTGSASGARTGAKTSAPTVIATASDVTPEPATATRRPRRM